MPEGKTQGRRPLTRDIYERAVTAFREHPGNVKLVAKQVGIGAKFAMRIWKGPPWQAYPWAEPAVVVIDRERAEQEQTRREFERQAQAEEAARASARRREREARSAEDEEILRLARTRALTVLKVSAALGPALTLLVQTIVKSVDPQQGATVDLKTAMSLLSQHALLTKRAVDMGSLMIELSRLEQGLPTSIVSLDKPLTYEEAVQELKEAELEARAVRERVH